MTEQSANNKRIAKNTIFLYFRMLLMMAVNLYTSRVILQVLGVEDYGIYNVVGGVVSLLSIISSSLSTATQRFITFGLGKNDRDYLCRVFSISIYIHIAMCILIVVLAESIGLWFLGTELQIPLDRANATMWVYQCAVVSSVIMIMSVPYNATIIAHEKMGAFALISLLEVFLKLGIVYLLLLFSVDKLILYAILLVATQLCVRCSYTIYCKKHFEETKIQKVKDVALVKEIGLFSMWSLMGNAAYVSYTQGLNVLLNMFFAPTVNAARGIAVQVQSTVNQFVQSFQTALNPQIIKSYASADLPYMYNLVFRSARFSFFMLLILSLPILIETETILNLWLTFVPENTITFLRLILLTTWINSIANPLVVSVKATGKVKRYELIIGVIMLLILPISYIFLKLGYPPYIVFVVHLCMECVAQIARIFITRNLIGFSVFSFFKSVIFRIVSVVSVALVIPLCLFIYLDDSILSFLSVCFSSVVSCILSIYLLGLTNNERIMIVNKARSFCYNFKKKY